MATELVIRSWCDPCLDAGKETTGETITVNVSGVPAFDVEVCPEHGAPLLNVAAGLAAYGRAVGKGVPRTPTAAPGTPSGTVYTRPAPAGGVCPVGCGYVAPSEGSMRVHLRKQHGKSMADVGLDPARETCSECGSKFPNKQGLAAHFRIAHPDARRKVSA